MAKEASEDTGFKRFSEFYPFYLKEHSHPTCRALHYIGSSGALVILACALITGNYPLIILALIFGYACAWVGHFFFEHNKPATFKYPVYSLLGDWVMLKDFLLGRFRKG
ncbi:DUF962 domain-containing protein [Endozoicomonas sp. GU-1]|nr:DUF962 domain-containing protein [Endozoicomonas sp. GU-1]WBA84092.1 DUF962 domain-containing protein [Endozoicomonas sp. GU-1]WBA88811.1 DUF962 domain-containing protein [Endozoicomonas sp. GU-1]